MPELYKAVQMNYRVIECYEVWHYKETMVYDGIDESTGEAHVSECELET